MTTPEPPPCPPGEKMAQHRGNGFGRRGDAGLLGLDDRWIDRSFFRLIGRQRQARPARASHSAATISDGSGGASFQNPCLREIQKIAGIGPSP